MGDAVIAVWFSCGAASAMAAKLTLKKYGPDHEVRILNTPVKEEDEDNRRFLRDVEEWLNIGVGWDIDVSIETVVNERYPESSAVEVWDDRRFMSGVAGAPCTQELKKRARQQWEEKNHPDWHVLGFTADEKDRFDRFVLTERENTLPVLIDAGMTKVDCFMALQSEGIRLPRVYDLGYPNANCIGCVKATSPTYWNHVRKMHPVVFQERAEQSRELGARLARHNGERIFLDELPANAIGSPMKNMQSECGLFCEEDAV